MAVLWSKTKSGSHYEVRSAGQSRRLYTDGVFHSQWNPRQPVSSTVWDLLLLSAFFVRDLSALKNALILGVGGGAIIKKLQHFFEDLQVCGIDMDAVHLQVAQQFFACKGKGVKLVATEAQAWLNAESSKAERQSGFDLLVEDLFMPGSAAGEPLRAIDASTHWMRSLTQNLKPGGVLAMNFESERQARKAQLAKKTQSDGIQSIYLLQTEGYDNTIAVLCKHKILRNEFESRLGALIASPDTNCLRHLGFSMKSIRVL